MIEDLKTKIGHYFSKHKKNKECLGNRSRDVALYILNVFKSSKLSKELESYVKVTS